MKTKVLSRVEQTVEAAVRRRLLIGALEQSGWAAVFLLAGLIMLLLAGSLIFQWQWLLLLVAAGAALGIYRIRKCLLPRYAVAQILDRRLQLSDTLSTAFYLRSNPTADLSANGLVATDYQLEQAEKLAATIHPEHSFPFAGQRLWSVAAALAAVSLGLFFIRYMVTESLSLRPALVSLQIAPLIEHVREVLAPKKDASGLDGLPNRPATKAEQANGKDTENVGHAPEAPPPAISNASAEGSPAGQKAASESAKSGAEGEAQGKPGEAMAKQEAANQPGASAAQQSPNAGSKTPGSPQQTKEQAQSKEEKSGSQNSSPGVMSRMKDALSNMMAKMQAASAPQQNKSGQQAAAESKNGEQAQASGKPQQGSQSQQQQSPNQASNPNESAEGQAQGQTAEKQGTTQGKSSDQSAQKGSDAHSGVGQQDGDKDIRNAEQLKAMGKLAEIIGKRSANLTGDMTVETSSGKQELKTNYSQRVGQHTDSGGEINHNQVPLVYQQYVREYMEQVRKPEKSGPP